MPRTCDKRVMISTATRIPVRILLEHFEAGDRLDDFLTDYPAVTRNQAIDFLNLVISNLPKLDDEVAA